MKLMGHLRGPPLIGTIVKAKRPTIYQQHLAEPQRQTLTNLFVEIFDDLVEPSYVFHFDLDPPCREFDSPRSKPCAPDDHVTWFVQTWRAKPLPSPMVRIMRGS
jgi:hypothetical protein